MEAETERQSDDLAEEGHRRLVIARCWERGHEGSKLSEPDLRLPGPECERTCYVTLVCGYSSDRKPHNAPTGFFLTHPSYHTGHASLKFFPVSTSV